MAREEIIKVTCDRCGKVTKESYSAAKALGQAGLMFADAATAHEDYCEKCFGRVSKLASEIKSPPKRSRGHTE